MDTFCDYCKKRGTFTLFVHCDYQICEDHLLEQEVDPVTKKMKCLVCQEDFDLEQAKKTTKNQLSLLYRMFMKKYEDLLKRLAEYNFFN